MHSLNLLHQGLAVQAMGIRKDVAEELSGTLSKEEASFAEKRMPVDSHDFRDAGDPMEKIYPEPHWTNYPHGQKE